MKNNKFGYASRMLSSFAISFNRRNGNMLYNLACASGIHLLTHISKPLIYLINIIYTTGSPLL